MCVISCPWVLNWITIRPHLCIFVRLWKSSDSEMHKIHVARKNYTNNSKYIQNLCLLFNLLSENMNLSTKTRGLSTVQWQYIRSPCRRNSIVFAGQRWSNHAAQLRVLSTVEKVGEPFACQTGWTSAPLKWEPVVRRWQLYRERYDLTTPEQYILRFLLYFSNYILYTINKCTIYHMLNFILIYTLRYK